ncbi:ABC transporter permease [Streptococcus massiliensis]|uniref:Putative permease n=1 Tax=Streptococcus massiliensis TaxID=313439 RepID=A0A380L0W8_9STRE|nr:FtsX-like permease family protein [Streptococcus massiliensis]SUN77422.1 putative permease [Streptococcus massiliensis]
MFKLTSKLALSNLVKNRKLYYPFALATMIATAILYSFISLAYSPDMEKSYGGAASRMTLQFGIIVIQIAVLILVAYANSFVMKNRSRELGLYSILGMEKWHLLVMTFVELLLFFAGTVGLGLGVGFIFDKLLYAVLLKVMGMPVVLASTFQWFNIFLTLVSLAVAFALILLLNSARLLRYSSLTMIREKKAGEKKGRLLLLQTLIGLVLLGIAYYMALMVKSPVAAIIQFFWAVILVIAATYILFNAGSITFLQFLKKSKSYYRKPENMISVSNLVARMRKNAAGLATISILSTMLLVTLVGSINIYVGGKDYLDSLYPHAYNFSVSTGNEKEEDFLLKTVKELVAENQIASPSYHTYTYYTVGVKRKTANRLISVENGNRIPDMVFTVISSAEYGKMTGEKLSLADNETIVYAKDNSLLADKPLQVNDKSLTIKKIVRKDFSHGNIPNEGVAVGNKQIYAVVNDPSQIMKIESKTYYVGVDSSTEVKDISHFASQALDRLMTLREQETAGNFSFTSRQSVEKEYRGVVGTLLFIGIFLSVIFLIGAVLVIYYKQISEGYEDRDNFVILQKVGLDQSQTKRTIQKQILIVFFLPLVFAFVHLAVAFKMISLIVAMLGASNVGLLIQTTIGICLIFLIAYIVVFLLTARTYRKIVSH